MAQELIHEILPVGMLQCNCSIIGDPETREAIVLDPGDEVEKILAVIAKHHLKVMAIVSTHAHIDHVGGLKKLHDATHAPVFMNEADLALYQAMEMQAQFLGVRPPQIANVDDLLKEGDVVRWGGHGARVLHTPGHTPGSISLYLPEAIVERAKSDGGSGKLTQEKQAPESAPWLFAGDTLFAGSIGRTDLWGGSYPDIIRSIHTKLLALPESTIVFPGHGPTTTLAAERASNPFLQSR
ncbi:MAG TPA: MBL fold metallo-hydrolase [Candidatus Acidoferrales bacterium]|nr:MBL fold metallo-hydrolase [Candidatus Acidoferrales bacterium]HEV2342299.1 MBL fold metallo-hydrolase [Candidatus Acidoferrales bacterium]